MSKSVYTCRECGGTNPKWLGKCPHCGAWNTLDEGAAEPAATTKNRFQSLARSQPLWMYISCPSGRTSEMLTSRSASPALLRIRTLSSRQPLPFAFRPALFS